jgi:hypothetical protein
MTQKVIALVLVEGDWRLKTPSGNLFDAYFRGNQADAVEWARAFVSTWGNWIIQIQGDNCAQEN